MENKSTGLEETSENSDSTYEAKKKLVEEIHQLEKSIMEKLIKVIEMK